MNELEQYYEIAAGVLAGVSLILAALSRVVPRIRDNRMFQRLQKFVSNIRRKP